MPSGPVQQRQVGVGGRLRAQRAQDHHLARGVRDVVLAAHHVGDAHVAVVDRHGEVVERAAVRAADHEVLDRLIRRGDLAADLVVDDRLALVRHAQAHRALVLVGVPVGEQLLDRLGVRGRPLGLRERPLVPVELEPAQRVEDLLDVLRGGALAVGVLDAQHELAALAARQQPVVQCRPRAADVQHARRAMARSGPSSAFDANRRTRLDGRRPRGGAPARRRARLRRDPGLQPVAAPVAPHALEAGRRGRVPRADEGRPDRVGHDPRRLPDQPGHQGPRRCAASRPPR